MVKVRDIYNAIDAFAPFETAEAYDNVGILIDCDNETEKILFALDATEDTILEACAQDCGVLVVHHPAIFGGITRIQKGDPVMEAAKAGISVIAAHTNFDRAAGGVNDVLTDLLELGTISPFGNGMGRIGLLKEQMMPDAFAEFIKNKFEIEALRMVPGKNSIKTVAVCGGSGDLVIDAFLAGADALVTGEVRHENALLAKRYGITTVAAGHFATENPGIMAMCGYLQRVFGDDAECMFSKCGRDPLQVR